MNCGLQNFVLCCKIFYFHVDFCVFVEFCGIWFWSVIMFTFWLKFKFVNLLVTKLVSLLRLTDKHNEHNFAAA